MDFDAAIIAHKRWKDRLKKSAAGGEQLDVATLGRDDACDLGKYIQAAPAAEQALPEFKVLREKHAQFHKVAAGTVRSIAGKDAAEVDTLLGGVSLFGQASAACVSAIAALRDRTGKGA